MLSKNVNKGKTDYSNKTQRSYIASARSLPNKYFSAGVSRCAFYALLKKHTEMGNTEDGRYGGQPRKLSAAGKKKKKKEVKLISPQNQKMPSSTISSELAKTSKTIYCP